MAVTVRLGSITFGGGPDVDGDVFRLSDIDGWESPTVELQVVDRPTADGAIVASGRYGRRPLVLIGSASAPTPDAVWTRVRRKLTAATNLVAADGTLYVDEPDGNTYTLAVRLADQLRVRRTGPYGIEFEVSLLAADPHKTLVP